MKKSWGLTQKILSGEKTIETRWYKTRRLPWDQISKGDIIYFKDSGCPVTARAIVKEVRQYAELTEEKRKQLLHLVSPRDLGTTDIRDEILKYIDGKQYCIVVSLANPAPVAPFNISKKGFGSMSAWIIVDDINQIMI